MDKVKSARELMLIGQVNGWYEGSSVQSGGIVKSNSVNLQEFTRVAETCFHLFSFETEPGVRATHAYLLRAPCTLNQNAAFGDVGLPSKLDFTLSFLIPLFFLLVISRYILSQVSHQQYI